VTSLLATTETPVLATRVSAEHVAALRSAIADLQVDEVGRVVVARAEPGPPTATVAVVSAGTSDLPVARECATVLEAFAIKADIITDVGVAGVHRVLSARDRLAEADVVVVVAGMEGALPSVVGGLVDRPVIAVPTSVGYGAAFEGVAALLGMLTSCAPGIAVVNIDNGFGAAMVARRILRARP
jgi:NCAIR mutase (PurE)-related protein